MELSRRLKKEHKELIKQVIRPALGALATGYVVAHRGEITAYIQRHKNGLKAGLAKGVEPAEIRDFGARFKWLGRTKIETTNMSNDDIAIFRSIMNEKISDNPLQNDSENL